MRTAEDDESNQEVIKNLTKQELKAIQKLDELANIWPKSLWLFSASGLLCVMKKDENGNRVHTASGGVDQSQSFYETSKIENDGGDW